MKALAEELSGAASQREPTLRDRLSDALATFATHGAYEAAREAQPILKAAAHKAELLQRPTLGDPATEVRAFLALRELNSALFETSSLNDLLIVGEDDDQRGTDDERLGDLFQQVTNWLVIREGDPLEETSQVKQFTTRLRQLRTMLHLVDADGPDVDPRKELVRQRRLLTQRVLLNRIQRDAPGSLRRTLCAATARTCDALVREDSADVSEILMAAAEHVSHVDDLKAMAEASMVPEIESALRAYAKLQQATRLAQRDGHGLVAATDAMKAIGIELPVARSARIEAFRQALSLLARGLRSVGSVQLACGSCGALVGHTALHSRTRCCRTRSARQWIPATTRLFGWRRVSGSSRGDLGHGARGRARDSYVDFRDGPCIHSGRQRD